jgi:ABC-2 type transport system permease protein
MKMGIFRFADIFCKLVATNFYIARQELGGQIINFYIWAFCSLVVMGYVMQAFGLAADYGSFQLATVMGTVGLFQVYGNSFRCIVDFEGERHIGYCLTLPVSPSVVWWSMICSYSLTGLILSVLMLPFGKLLLFNSFSLTNISWIKTAIILVLANIFYGVFTIAITAHVGAMSKMENVWSRFIFPMWFLGGFQFSWASIYELSTPLAYVLLCNPIMFIMEGTRAALLGAQDCLPWGLCCMVLCGFTVVGWLYAQYKMKRLLDLV